MAKKRTTNRSLIGAGKPFKAIKDKSGNTNFAKSIQFQSGTPSPKLSKHISRQQVYPPPPPGGAGATAKMNFKASAKMQEPMKANVKTTVRFKGLEKMKSKIAKSPSTKSKPIKSKTITKKPPSKGR